MPMTSCIVDRCESTDRNSVLFYVPRNPDLRGIWRQMLEPHASRLRDRDPARQLAYRVCAAHFEPKYLVQRGNRQTRKSSGFPTLFKAEEISSGRPTVPVTISKHTDHNDHTYAINLPIAAGQTQKRRLSASEAEEISMHLKKRCLVWHDHTYSCSSKDVVTITNKEAAPATLEEGTRIIVPTTSECTNEPTPTTSRAIQNPECSHTGDSTRVISEPAPPPSGLATNTCQDQEGKGQRRRIRLTNSVRKMTPRCQRIYKKCLEVVRSKRRLSFSYEQKLNKARQLNENHSFRNMLQNMSPQAQTFLEMQISKCNKHAKSRRFSVEEKLLALSLSRQSPKGYKLLQKMFVLPSKRTLNKFVQNVQVQPGINPNIFRHLKETVQHWNQTKKFCAIVYDEMSISSYLKFIESEDRIDGFVDFGGEAECKFADHVLVFMVRGICSSWRQTIAYYFCEGTTPFSTMKNILRDIVDAVAETGLVPKALVCDQGSTFQRALKSFQADTKREQILNGDRTDNRVNINGHILNIIYDPPHLIKGVRNNFLSKNMLFKGKLARWSDIIDVYKADCSLGLIRALPKLTDEHVIPEKIKKMKVRNCTQVLSERTSAMLMYTSKFENHCDGTPVSRSMADTGEAVLFFDRLFDSVNGSRGGAAPGKLRGAVKDVNGQSAHVAFWKESIQILKNLKFISSGPQPCPVVVPSVTNWITTLESFTQIWFDLKDAGVKYFYTRHLNQDPIENFFGRIRALNYRNNRPDVFSFKCAFKSLLLNDILAPHSSSFNCEDDSGLPLVDPKRFFVENDSSASLRDTESSSRTEQTASGSIVSSVEPERMPSLFHQARRERISVHMSAFTAGYVSRRLINKFRCNDCKKTFLTSDHGEIHTWISFRERRYLKGKNLKYPAVKFVLLFRELIDVINQYLDEFPQNRGVVKNIHTKFLSNRILDWFGCEQHRIDALNFFIRIVCRVQIHSWCNTLNNIVRGAYLERLTPPLPRMQSLALDKFKRSSRFKKR